MTTQAPEGIGVNLFIAGMPVMLSPREKRRLEIVAEKKSKAERKRKKAVDDSEGV